MKIIEKIKAKAGNNTDQPPVTIAFLGDSVTQGCFEIIPRNDKGFVSVHDRQSVYHTELSRMLSILYPTVPLNIINAGVAGKTAKHGLERLHRDVISRSPDLTVVCFGLNDCGNGENGIEDYTSSLREIFKRLKAENIEIIFMTPNMMATGLSPLLDEKFIELAGKIIERQNNGMFDKYLECAKEVCNECGVMVCDCYAKWKKLYENGVDITELLANKINHPTREMHKLFAVSLLETMMK